MNKEKRLKIFGMVAMVSFFINLILIGGLIVMQHNWNYNERVIVAKDMGLDSCIITIDNLIEQNEKWESKFDNLLNVSNEIQELNFKEHINLLTTCYEIKSECQKIGGCYE